MAIGPLRCSRSVFQSRRDGEGRAAEHLSARGRSERRIMEPGITAARPGSSVFELGRRRRMFAVGAQQIPGYSSESRRQRRAQAVNSAPVVEKRSARVVNSEERWGSVSSRSSAMLAAPTAVTRQ